MFLDKEERLMLLLEIKRKELSLTKIASEVNISVSLLSQYLNNKCQMSQENIKNVMNYIKSQKEYRYIRVPVES